MLCRTVLIVKRIRSFKIKLLILNSRVFISISSAVKASSQIIVITLTFNLAMNQLSFTYFNWIYSKLSNVYNEPSFFRIFLSINIFNLEFFWCIIFNNPLNFHLHILFIIVSQNSKSKKINVFQWLECYSIPTCRIQIEIIWKVIMFKSDPFFRFTKFYFLYKKGNFLVIYHIIFF